MRIKVLIALFIFLIIMGILGFAPVRLHEEINDKVLHFTVFFIFSTFLYFLWDLSVKRNLMLATITFLIVAVGSEFIQGFLPYRSFDVYDITANLLGGTMGISLSSLIDFCLHKHKENKRRFGGQREAEYQRALMDFTDDDSENEDVELKIRV